MPKLWNETIEEHRRAVRDAALDATADLVSEHGLTSVTMSQVAQETGIGRATLYKYFADVDSILVAWHERLVAQHVQHLADVRDRPGSPHERLEAVLETYADLQQHHVPSSELASLLHRGEHVAHAHHQLKRLLSELIADAAHDGDVRDDITPGELANFCVHALAGAARLRSKASVRRLVDLTLAGLRSTPSPT